MDRFEALLRSDGPILLDGAMGTTLQALGLAPGSPPEVWLVDEDHRAIVRSVHSAYVEAGARVVLTDSFGATSARLARHGIGDARAINALAARTAREAVGRDVVVGGSMGPTGELLEPFGGLSVGAAREAFSEQAAGLAEGGVDVLWVETMIDPNELRAAVEGARAGAPGIAVVGSMSFGRGPATMMGTRPADLARLADELDLAAVGVNCGDDPTIVELAVGALLAAGPGRPVFARPNAGMPRLEAGRAVYDAGPDVMAATAVRLVDLGVGLVGGCCGTTSDHIRAMGVALAGR